MITLNWHQWGIKCYKVLYKKCSFDYFRRFWTRFDIKGNCQFWPPNIPHFSCLKKWLPIFCIVWLLPKNTFLKNIHQFFISSCKSQDFLQKKVGPVLIHIFALFPKKHAHWNTFLTLIPGGSISISELGPQPIFVFF